MKQIECNQCNKLLFSTEKENAGAIGAEAQINGFVYKNAVLYSDKYTSLYFCNDNCAKEFYEKNIPKNKEISNILKEIRSEIPQMAADCARGLAELSKILNNNKPTKK